MWPASARWTRATHDVVADKSTVAEIAAAIEKLSREEQRQLAAWFDARFGPVGIDPAMEDAWADEVTRRIEELDSGRIQAVPAEQVLAEVRKIVGR